MSMSIKKLIERAAKLAEIAYNEMQITTVRLPKQMAMELRKRGIPIAEATRALLYLLLKRENDVKMLLQEVVESI